MNVVFDPKRLDILAILMYNGVIDSMEVDMSVEVRAVTMYPQEWAIVDQYARILEPAAPNVSATLRAIVREWHVTEGRKLAEMERGAEEGRDG